jgi:hypothetical protein
MEDIIDILQTNEAGLFLNVMEQFHIYANTESNIHLHDTFSDRDNQPHLWRDPGPYITAHNIGDTTQIQYTFGTTAQLGAHSNTESYT